jgi:hypothetical protein
MRLSRDVADRGRRGVAYKMALRPGKGGPSCYNQVRGMAKVSFTSTWAYPGILYPRLVFRCRKLLCLVVMPLGLFNCESCYVE